MANLTEPEIIEKWAHIAMKLFPPQMEITPTPRDGGWAICARWKAAEDDSSTVRKWAKGVDLCFSKHAVAEYRDAAADFQLKWDAVIENCINEKLRSCELNEEFSTDQAVEQWVIPLGRSDP